MILSNETTQYILCMSRVAPILLQVYIWNITINNARMDVDVSVVENSYRIYKCCLSV